MYPNAPVPLSYAVPVFGVWCLFSSWCSSVGVRVLVFVFECFYIVFKRYEISSLNDVTHVCSSGVMVPSTKCALKSE